MRRFLTYAVSCLLLTITIRLSVRADDFPTPISFFVAGAEEIVGVENAAEKYPQYREQNVVVANNGTVVVVCLLIAHGTTGRQHRIVLRNRRLP